jgi:hypothetical protein
VGLESGVLKEGSVKNQVEFAVGGLPCEVNMKLDGKIVRVAVYS